MVNKSKFRINTKVKFVLNKFEVYTILAITKNDLIVSPIGKDDLKFRCPKRIFENIRVITEDIKESEAFDDFNHVVFR